MKWLIDVPTGGSIHHRALFTALGFLCGLFTAQGRPAAGLTLGIAAAVVAVVLFRLDKAPRVAWVTAGAAIGVGASLLLTLFAVLGS